MSKSKKRGVMEQKKQEVGTESDTCLELKENTDMSHPARKIPEAALNVSEQVKKEIRPEPKIEQSIEDIFISNEVLCRKDFNTFSDLFYQLSDNSVSRFELYHEMSRTWWNMIGHFYLSLNPFK